MAVMCRRVGSSLRAGLDIRRVLENETDIGSHRHQQVMTAVHTEVMRGTSFSDAMRGQGDYFPPLLRTMAHVGEQTGKLSEVLLRLAEHYEGLLTIRAAYLLAILWPALQFGAAIVIVGLLIWVAGMLGEGSDLLGFGLRGTKGLVIYASLVGAVCLGGVTLWKMVNSPNPLGHAVQRLLLRVPLLGNAIVAQIMARASWSMAMIADSSLSNRVIARSTLESTESDYFIRFSTQIDDCLRKGKELHEAFRETHVFPEDFVQVLKTGELTGTLVESLKRLSREYDERSKLAWGTVAVAGALLTWLSVAILIIYLIFRIFYVSYYGRIQEFLP